MRNKIKEKLLEIDSKVFYGIVPEIDIEEWNYIVFGQRRIRKSGTSSNDLNGYWYVAIVRENWIDDETVKQVLSKMLEISGLRLANEDMTYDYTFNGNTNNVVEMLVLMFTKTKKGLVE